MSNNTSICPMKIPLGPVSKKKKEHYAKGFCRINVRFVHGGLFDRYVMNMSKVNMIGFIFGQLSTSLVDPGIDPIFCYLKFIRWVLRSALKRQNCAIVRRNCH